MTNTTAIGINNADVEQHFKLFRQYRDCVVEKQVRTFALSLRSFLLPIQYSAVQA